MQQTDDSPLSGRKCCAGCGCILPLSAFAMRGRHIKKPRSRCKQCRKEEDRTRSDKKRPRRFKRDMSAIGRETNVKAIDKLARGLIEYFGGMNRLIGALHHWQDDPRVTPALNARVLASVSNLMAVLEEHRFKLKQTRAHEIMYMSNEELERELNKKLAEAGYRRVLEKLKEDPNRLYDLLGYMAEAGYLDDVLVRLVEEGKIEVPEEAA